MSSADDELTPGQREIHRLAEDPTFRRKALGSARHALWRHGFQMPAEAAEDVYHSAVLRLLRYFERHEPQEIKDLRSYFLMVVLNEARRLAERERQGPRLVQLEDDASSVPDPLENVVNMESTLLLREFMRHLPEHDRPLFELWLEGFTVRGIGAVMRSRGLKISHVTVHNRLKLIQKELISFLG